MKGSGDYKITGSLSTSRDLEKSMCRIQHITLGNAHDMTSLEGFIQQKPEAENLVESLLTVM